MRACGLQRLGRPGLLGVRVLDRLRLVQDREPPCDFRQRRHAQQRAIAGDGEIELAACAGANCFDLLGGHRRGMDDHGVQVGRESFDLRSPVGQQRGRRHQQAWRRTAPGAFAPAAAPAPGWSCRGPCRRPGRRRGRGPTADAAIARRPADRAAACRAAPGRDRRPSPSGARKAFRVSASQGPAVTCDQSAAGRVVRARPRPPRRPACASPRRSVRPSRAASARLRWNCRIARSSRSRSTSTHWPRSSTSASVPASSVAISCSLSVSPSSVTSMRKSSNAVQPERPTARASPTVPVTCGRGGRLARQLAGMRTTTPARSSSGALASSRDASRGRPAQRMEDLARVDHRPQPGAGLGGALHRQQQRQQLVAVGRAGVFAQRLAERQMLRLGLRREPRGVGRHEGERRPVVAAVLGEIEMHAADQVPGRVQALQEALEVGLRGGQRRAPAPLRSRPQRAQHVGRQVFGARHHRRRQHQSRRVRLRLAAGCPGSGAPSAPDVQAQRRHVARGEPAPPDEDRRQGVPDLAGAELQQPVAAAPRERLGRGGPLSVLRVPARRRTVRRKMPMRVRRRP